MILIRLVISTFIFVFFALFGLIANASPSDSEYFIYPNSTGTFHDVTYGAWLVKFWQWWLSIPNSEHPVHDPGNGEKCGINQNDPVWFLPPHNPETPEGKTEIHCNIPVGKDIILPISVTECDKGTGDDVDENNDGSYLDCTENILTRNDDIMILLDGKAPDKNKYLKIKGDFFNVTLNDDTVDIYEEVIKGTWRAKIYGIYLILHGLPPGEHNIDFFVHDRLRGNTGVDEINNKGSYKIMVS